MKQKVHSLKCQQDRQILPNLTKKNREIISKLLTSEAKGDKIMLRKSKKSLGHTSKTYTAKNWKMEK